MNDNYLEHYGVPRRSGRYPWGSGSRPFQGDSSAAKSSGKIGLFKKGKTKTESSKEDLSEISSEDLQKRIDRIQLEQKYQELTTKPKTVSKGRQILSSILEASSKNIGAQLSTYLMGTTVNSVAKAFGAKADIVNPKKGQKDK